MAICLISMSAWANKTVSGKVISAIDNEPLIGATVQAVGTNQGTSTDYDGQFTVTVDDKVTQLLISCVGYKAQVVAVASYVSVALEEDKTLLDEVVVTAMGIKREKKALGYNTQNLNAEDLNTSGTTSLANAIQGKLTGVQVHQASGAPGSSAQIVIRGARSFSGNNTPLYVVDGMPIASNADFSTGQSVTGADYPNRSIDLNPDDIESINVLKGQAASALYGMRASNGVIVITTKRGRVDSERPTVSINFNIAADRVSRKFERQTVYSQGNGLSMDDDGTIYDSGFNPASSMTWGPKITELPNDPNYGYGGAAAPEGGSPGQYYNPKYAWGGLSGWQTPKVYDNVGDFFENAYTENVNLSIAQKHNNVNYSFGLSNSYQKGIVPSTNMTRWGARGLVDWEISKNWKTGFSGNYSSSKINTAPGANSGILNVVYAAPAEYDLKGISPNFPDDPKYQVCFRTTSFNNPYWWAKYCEYYRHTNRFFGNAYLEFSPSLGNENMKLTFREQAGVDFWTTDNRDVQELYYDGRTGNSMEKGSISVTGVRENVFNNLFWANLDYKFGADNEWFLNFMLGNEINHENARTWETDGSAFSYFGFPTLQNCTSYDYAMDYEWKDRSVAFFGQATMSWKDMLYLTVTGREDIVSSMPYKNRSFFYPSVSFGWIFTELPGLKGNKFLSYGKFRASWAQVGQAGHYYKDYYTVPTYGSGMYTYTPVAFPMNGVSSLVPYYVKYDSNLKPQNTNNFETGLDLNFFNNRLRLEYTLSYQNVTDQIFSVPCSGSSGYQYLMTNAGKMETWSHEVALNADILQNKDYDLTFGVNFSKINNKVVELAEGVESIFLGGFVEPQIRAQAGCTYPNIYGYAFKRDESGNLLLKDGLPQATADSEDLGNCSPDFQVGFNLGARYKRVSLATTWDWNKGGRMYHGTLGTLEYFGTTKNSLPYHEGTMVAEGIDEATGKPNTKEVLKQDWYMAYYDITEAMVYDMSYLKLRDITLTYDLPRFAGINLSIYGFARNVLVWSKLTDFDPESSQSNGNMSGYFERYSLPATSSYGGGMKITF